MSMSLQAGTTSINELMQVPVAATLYEVPQMNGCVNVLFHHINSHPERLYSMLNSNVREAPGGSSMSDV